MKGLTVAVNRYDGAYTVLPFEGGVSELQAAVGGYIEAFPTKRSHTVWINEEGKLLGLPRNYLAEAIVRPWDEFNVLGSGDYLAGNAVICGGTDKDGNTLPIRKAQRAWVLRVAREAGAIISEDAE